MTDSSPSKLADYPLYIKNIAKITIEPKFEQTHTHPQRSFRKPKKVVKTFQVQTQPSIQDQLFIQQEIKGWLTRLSDNKPLKANLNDLTKRTKQVIFDQYNTIRNNETLAHCLPLTERKKSRKIKTEAIQLDFEQVQKIKIKQHAKKIQISPSEFKTNLPCPEQKMHGFRPSPNKTAEKRHISKRNQSLFEFKNQSFFSMHDYQDNLTGRALKESALSLKQHVQTNKAFTLPVKSNENLPFTQRKRNCYSRKSRLKTLRSTLSVEKCQIKSANQ